MRTYLKETIKPLIPEAVRNSIVSVTKEQPSYNTTGTSETQTTEDTVWIPSYNECYGSTSMYYALFKNTNANSKKYKVGSSSAAYWWLRSAYGTSNFRNVNTSGSYSNGSASTSYGVPLGFCV